MFKQLFNIFSESANSFEGQEKDEKVILLLRRFPFWVMNRIGLLASLAFLPTIFGLASMPFLISHKMVSLFWFVLLVWVLILWLWAFYTLTLYSLDVWIVTDRRIIDVTQQGLFHRTVSELHLSRVQDISVHTKGFFHSLFHFGNLQVQTAAADERFKFLEIKHPEKIKDTIMQAVAAARSNPRA